MTLITRQDLCKVNTSFRRKPESRVLYRKDLLGSRFRGNDGLLPKVDDSDFAYALD